MMNNLGNKTVMAANIQYYMGLYGETRKELSDLFQVPYTTICDWINAKTYPRIDKIELMARHWNIDKSALVEPPKIKANKFLVPVLGSVIAPTGAELNIVLFFFGKVIATMFELRKKNSRG